MDIVLLDMNDHNDLDNKNGMNEKNHIQCQYINTQVFKMCTHRDGERKKKLKVGGKIKIELVQS